MSQVPMEPDDVDDRVAIICTYIRTRWRDRLDMHKEKKRRGSCTLVIQEAPLPPWLMFSICLAVESTDTPHFLE